MLCFVLLRGANAQTSAIVTLSSTTVPSAGQPGITSITVTGSGFPDGTISPASITVTLSPSAGGAAASTSATSIATVVGSTRRCTFVIPASISVGAPSVYQVSLAGTSAAGVAFASGTRAALTVNPAARLVSATPLSATAGQSAPVLLAGQFTSFTAGFTEVRFGPGISVGGGPVGDYGTVTVTGPTSAIAQVSIDAAAAAGPRTIEVKTGSEWASLAGGFTVVAAGEAQSTLVTLDQLTIPASGLPGDTIVVAGSGFPGGAIDAAAITVTLEPATAGSGATLTSKAVTVAPNDGGTRQLQFQIPTTVRFTADTPYRVSISGTTAAGVIFSSQNKAALTINASTGRLLSVAPASGSPGRTLTVSISGQFTNLLQGAAQASLGPGISVGGGPDGGFGPITVLDPNTASAQVAIAATASIGGRTLLVKNGAEQFTLTNGFNVIAPSDPPQFLASSPAAGDTAVPVNAPLMMDFSKAVNASMLTAAIQVRFAGNAVPGAFTLSADNRRVTFVPSVPWAPASVHTVVIAAALTDSTGTPIDNPSTFTFTTTTSADTVAPSITQIDPANGAVNVGAAAVVRVTFSERMNALTINGSSFQVFNAPNPATMVPVAGSVAVAADRLSATFSPAAPLASSTRYAIHISGMTDIAGILLNPFPDTSFTIAGYSTDIVAPAVIAITPADGSTGVAVNTRVVAQLSKPANPLTVTNNAIAVSRGGVPIAGSVALSSDFLTLTFTPVAVLPPGTTEVRVLVSGFTDQAGSAVIPFTSGFSTALSVTADTTPPAVVAISPKAGATAVAVSSPVMLTFSEPVDATSVNSQSIKITMAMTGASVPGTFAVNGSTVTFTPASPFPNGTRIAVIVGAVKDPAGNAAIPFSTTFDTIAVADTTPPQVVLVTPSNGTTSASINTDVVLTFSEPLAPGTINSNTVALLAGGAPLSTAIVLSSDNRTVTLSALLPAATTVTVIATRDIADLAGNHLSDFRSQFTTPLQPSDGRPSVVSQRPGDGSGGIPLNSAIFLFTDTPLNATTVNGALRVSQNGVLVSGTVRVSGGGQAIEFTPAAPLGYDKLIQVFLDSPAADLAGKTVHSYQGSFRTIADPAATPVAATRYSLDTTDVPLNPVLDVEFSKALDPATVNGASVQFYAVAVVPPATTGGVQYRVTLRGDRIVRVVPAAPLLPNTQYCSATTSPGIRDLQGTSASFQFCFSTGILADTAAPQVIAVSPPDGASGIGVNAAIRVRFSDPVNPLTVDGNTIRVSGAGASLGPFTIGFADHNRDVEIVPNGLLPESAVLTLTISGVEDAAGNVVAPRTTQFTTRAGPDVSVLTLSRTNPADGAKAVPVNAVLSLEFNRPVDPLSVNKASLLVSDVAGPVAGSYSVSADGRTAIFVPDAPWGVGRTVTVNYSAIQDLAGNRVDPPCSSCSASLSFTLSFTPDTTPPSVLQVSPANGLTAVPINATVTIAFSEAVQAQSVNQVTLRAAAALVPVTRVLSAGNRVLTLLPAVPLSSYTLYTVTIAGVKDLAGNLLSGAVSSNFVTGTGADLTPPSIVVNPPDGGTAVGTNATITARFTERINPVTVSDATFQVVNAVTSRPVAGTMAVSADQLSATFTPASLAPSTQYTVQISGVTDLAGNGVAFFTGSTFTTAFAADTTAPRVIAVSPPDGSTGVPPNARILVQVSKPVSPATVANSAITVTSNSTPLPGNVTLSPDLLLLTFTPVAVLPPGSNEVRVLVSGFADQSGNAVVPFSSGFSSSSAAAADTVPPTVISVTPPASVAGPVVLTFSEPLDPTSVNAQSIAVSLQSTGAVIPGSYVVNGAAVIFTPVAPLPGGVRVVVAVRANSVRDLAGNPAPAYSTSFDTSATADTIPPEIVAVVPAPGSSNIGPNAPVILTFSEPLDPRTITAASFGLLAGNTRLPFVTVSSSDNRTVTLIATLPAASTITIVATRDITDLSGNRLPDFHSQFTTSAQPETGRPSVVSQRPDNGAAGVPLDSAIVLFTDKPLNAATAKTGLRVSQNGSLVAGTVSVSGGGQTIQFTPAAPWRYGALVQVFLDAPAADLSGNAIHSYQSTFRTVPDPAAAAPYAVRYSVGAATPAPLNPVLEVEFSEALNPATVNANTVRFYGATGTAPPVQVSLRGDRVVRIVPAAPLLANAKYCYSIGNDAPVRDLQGIAADPGFESCFTTGTDSRTVAPQLVAVSPPDGISGVGVNAGIRVRFSGPVNPLTVDGNTIRVSGGGVIIVPYTISFADNNRDVRIVPYGLLPEAALMTIAISGIEDISGNVVTARTTQFLTASTPDVGALTLLRTNPPNAAIAVGVNTVLTMEFNRAVDPLSVNADNVRITDIAGTVAGSYSVSADGKVVMFAPATAWGVGRNISVDYVALQDLAGNRVAPTPCCEPPLSFSISFTPDTTTPHVLQVSPSNGIDSVPINTQVTIAFDEPVQTRSIGEVTVAAGGAPVAVTRLLSDGNRTLTLTPTVPLNTLTLYTVTIGGVKDLAANPLATPPATVFRTGAGADIAQPSAIASPPNGAAVGTNAVVTVQFSERVNPVMVNASTFRVTNAATALAAPGSIALSPDGRTATFTPAGLGASTQYVVEIAGVTDLAGNGLLFFRPSNFTTAAAVDTVAPSVAAISPPDGSTGVPPNARIVVRLSKPVNPASVTASAVAVTNNGVAVTGGIALSPDFLTLTFTPMVVLPPGTNEVRVLVSGFTDQAGNTVVPFASTFTAFGSAPDVTAPALLSVTPESGATRVPVSSAVVLTFSKPLDATSVNSQSLPVFLQSTGVTIPGNYAVSGATVTFTPVAAFPGGARIAVSVRSYCCPTISVRDLAGNSAAFSVSTFDTAAAADVTPPQVALVTPGDGSSNVGPNAPVVLTFSEPVDPRTINVMSVTLLAGNTRLPSIAISSADNRTVTLQATLPAASTITVAVTHDVTDLSGNHLPDFVSRFTTAAQADTARPSVVMQRPGNAATGVPLNAPIVLFTDKPLQAATIPGALHVSQNGVLVEGTVVPGASGQTIQFTPAVPWQFDALIQVFLDPTAVDLAGNGLYRYEASFRTAANPATAALAAVRFSIGQNATAVPLNAIVEVDFNKALDPAAVNASRIQFYPVAVVPPATSGTVQYQVQLRGDRVVRIVPVPPLLPNRQYCYAGTVQDLQGTPASFESCFTTGTATTTAAPQIVALSPPDGASGVGVNAGIRIRFSDPVNPLTVDGNTVQVVAAGTAVVPYAVSFAGDNRDVRIVPYGLLPESSSIAVTISGVQDIAGNVVTSRTSAFATASSPQVGALTLLRSNPPSGAANVGVNTVLTLEFDRPVDPLSVNSINLHVSDIAGTVAGSYSLSSNGQVVMFAPAAAWAVGRKISVEYAGVQDLAGNQVSAASPLSFTASFTADTAPPHVLQVSPGNDIEGVPVNAQVAIAFDEPIQAQSIEGIAVLAGGIPAVVTRILSNGNRTVTVIPSLPWNALTVYTVAVSGIRDLAGNLLATPLTTTFRTGAGVALSQPSVVVSPPDGAAAVGTNAVVTAQFSERVNALTVDGSSFRVVNAATSLAVAGTVALSADGRTAIFTPAVLSPSTSYLVQVAGITDLAGNGVALFATSRFTTASGADVVRPAVAGVSPPDGSTGVPPNTRVVVRLSKPVNPASVNAGSVAVTANGVPVAGDVALSADFLTLTFTPLAVLPPGSNDVRVLVSGFTDHTGNLVAPFSSSFTTSTSGAPDFTPLTVVSVNPPEGTTTRVTSPVIVTFSKPPDPTSVNSQSIRISLRSSGATIPGSYAVDGTTVTFTPVAPFPARAGLAVTVGDCCPSVPVRDLTGASLSSTSEGTRSVELNWAGSTSADVVGYRVYRGMVPRGPYHLLTPLVVSATTYIDRTVQTGRTFYYAATSVTGKGEESGYSMEVAASIPGMPAPTFYSTFETDATADTTPPRVTLVTPSAGSSNVGPNGPVVLTFSEPLDPRTIGTFSLGLLAGSTQLPFTTVSSSDNRTVTLLATLPPASTITVVATSALTDLSGNQLADFRSEFTTAPAADITRPSVVAQRPPDAAAAVPVNTPVVLFVDKPLNPATVSAAFRVSQNGVLVTGTVLTGSSGQTITFTPAVPWQYNALVEVFLDSTATDAAGNAVFSYQASFRTAADPASSSPYPVRFSIGQDSTGVPLNPVVEVEFSEALDPGSVNAVNVRFSPVPSGTVPYQVQLRGDRVVRIMPAAPLLPRAQYCYEGVVRDLQGVVAELHSCFQTGTASRNVAPQIVAVSPPDGAPGIGVNAGVRVRFSQPVNPLTIDANTIRVSSDAGVLVSYTAAFSDENRNVWIVPYGLLPESAAMTVTVSGVEDVSGNVVAPRSTHFSTAAAPELGPLRLLRTNPPNQADGVAVNTPLMLEFDRPVDPFSTNGASVRITDVEGRVPGTYSLSLDGRTVFFVPAQPWPVGREISVDYLAVRDLAGNRVARPACCSSVPLSFSIAFASDTAPPEVAEVSPDNAATGVPINTQLKISFTEPVQSMSIDEVTLSTGGVVVAVGRVLADGNITLVLTPALPLQEVTTYTLAVSGVRDLAGNTLAPVSFTFTTGTGADLGQVPALPERTFLPGLVAAYSFDEGAGSTVADSSGYANTGQIHGAAWTPNAIFGDGLSFDGVSNYVDLGSPPALKLTGSMTVSAWVYPTVHPHDDGQIVTRSTDISGWQLKTTPDTGRRTFAIAVTPPRGALTQRYSNTVVALNTWYHVAGVYDAAAGTLDIYVNGVLDNGTLIGSVPASQANPDVAAAIGMRSGGYYFHGTIDEVRLYNVALSGAQIQADMRMSIGSQ